MTMIGVNKSYVFISNASDPILGNDVTNNLTNPVMATLDLLFG